VIYIRWQKARIQAEASKREDGRIESAVMEHVAGLPVGDGVACEVSLYPDKYAFKYDEDIYSLSFDRIRMCR
jgi:hypothetical protein